MEPARPSVADILSAVCAVRGISLADLKGSSKCRRVAHPRQEAMAVARRLTGHSTPTLGRIFGRDHTTVIFACRAVARRERQSAPYGAELCGIASLVSSAADMRAAQAVGRFAQMLGPLPEAVPANREIALREAWKRQAASVPPHLSNI